MRLVLHHNKRQQASCLESLAEYAQEIARTAFAREFSTLGAFVGWCRLQPVKEDCGESPQRGGCNPTQRATVWPWNGLNCWEATAHFVGVAMALQPDVVVHVYDVDTEDGGRHVFPALQNVLGGPEWEVVLQPSPTPRAQGWLNTVADVAHALGGVTLGIFGAGALVPLVEMAWKQAPSEYGLTKYQTQAPTQQPTTRQAEIAELQQRLSALLAEEKKSSPPTSEGGSGGSGRGSSSGSERGSRSQDTDRAVIEGGMITEEAEAPKDTDSEAVDFGGGDFDTADFGGGDFDTAAVDFGGGDFDTADFGGGDFDAAVVEFDGE